MAAGASAFESRLTAAHNLAGRAAGLSIARYMAEQTPSPDCVGVAVHVDIRRRTMHQHPRNRAEHRVEARLVVDTGRNLDLSDRRDAGLDTRGTVHRQIGDRRDDDCRPDH